MDTERAPGSAKLFPEPAIMYTKFTRRVNPEYGIGREHEEGYVFQLWAYDNPIGEGLGSASYETEDVGHDAWVRPIDARWIDRGVAGGTAWEQRKMSEAMRAIIEMAGGRLGDSNRTLNKMKEFLDKLDEPRRLRRFSYNGMAIGHGHGNGNGNAYYGRGIGGSPL